MRFKELGPVRSAMYGYDFRGSQSPGWFDELFENYSLHPYLNVLSPDTLDLLYRRNLFRKLVPVFSKKLRITSLINEIIGIDLLNNKDKGPGIVEELAKILLDEVESKETLGAKVAAKDRNLTKNHRHFAGLSEKIQGFENLPKLRDRGVKTDGALIAVQGVLSRIESLEFFNSALAESLGGSGLSWMISDLPFFSMVPGNLGYRGDLIALRIPNEIQDVLEQSPPFSSTFEWYPYVTAFGRFHESHNPQHLGLKVIDLAWIRIRRPRSFDDAIDKPLFDITQRQHSPVNKHVDLSDKPSALLYLSAILFSLGVHNATYDKAKDRFGKLVELAVPAVEDALTPKMRTFFSI